MTYDEMDGYNDGIDVTWRKVQNAPTVDAVPVVWMPIAGFDGLYEISNFGKVRNKDGKILKHGIKRTPCTCYKTVRLWKAGRYYTKYIHRLIAEAFIPNPYNLKFVNHKDEDGTNNDIENLEWCTREYNVNYGTAKERRVKKIKGVPSKKRKAVEQYSIDGEFICWYPSVTEAAMCVRGSTSTISAVCLGKRKTAYGYIWNYCPNCGANMRGDA